MLISQSLQLPPPHEDLAYDCISYHLKNRPLYGEGWHLATYLWVITCPSDSVQSGWVIESIQGAADLKHSSGAWPARDKVSVAESGGPCPCVLGIYNFPTGWLNFPTANPLSSFSEGFIQAGSRSSLPPGSLEALGS